MGLPMWSKVSEEVSYESYDVIYKSLYSMNFEYNTNENNEVEKYLTDNCIKYNNTMNYIEITFNVNEITFNVNDHISYETMLNKLSQIKSITININNTNNEIISKTEINNLKLSDYSFKQNWNKHNDICYLYTKFDKTTNLIKS